MAAGDNGGPIAMACPGEERSTGLIRLLAAGTTTLLESVTCRICLEPLRNPTRIVRCSHSFCKLCLDNALQAATKGKMACPLCKEPGVTRRSLQPNGRLREVTALVFRLHQELGEATGKCGLDFDRLRHSVGKTSREACSATWEQGDLTKGVSSSEVVALANEAGDTAAAAVSSTSLRQERSLVRLQSRKRSGDGRQEERAASRRSSGTFSSVGVEPQEEEPGPTRKRNDNADNAKRASKAGTSGGADGGSREAGDRGGGRRSRSTSLGRSANPVADSSSYIQEHNDSFDELIESEEQDRLRPRPVESDKVGGAGGPAADELGPARVVLRGPDRVLSLIEEEDDDCKSSSGSLAAFGTRADGVAGVVSKGATGQPVRKGRPRTFSSSNSTESTGIDGNKKSRKRKASSGIADSKRETVAEVTGGRLGKVNKDDLSILSFCDGGDLQDYADYAPTDDSDFGSSEKSHLPTKQLVAKMPKVGGEGLAGDRRRPLKEVLQQERIEEGRPQVVGGRNEVAEDNSDGRRSKVLFQFKGSLRASSSSSKGGEGCHGSAALHPSKRFKFFQLGSLVVNRLLTDEDSEEKDDLQNVPPLAVILRRRSRQGPNPRPSLLLPTISPVKNLLEPVHRSTPASEENSRPKTGINAIGDPPSQLEKDVVLEGPGKNKFRFKRCPSSLSRSVEEKSPLSQQLQASNPFKLLKESTKSGHHQHLSRSLLASESQAGDEAPAGNGGLQGLAILGENHAVDDDDQFLPDMDMDPAGADEDQASSKDDDDDDDDGGGDTMHGDLPQKTRIGRKLQIEPQVAEGPKGGTKLPLRKVSQPGQSALAEVVIASDAEGFSQGKKSVRQEQRNKPVAAGGDDDEEEDDASSFKSVEDEDEDEDEDMFSATPQSQRSRSRSRSMWSGSKDSHVVRAEKAAVPDDEPLPPDLVVESAVAPMEESEEKRWARASAGARNLGSKLFRSFEFTLHGDFQNGVSRLALTKIIQSAGGCVFRSVNLMSYGRGTTGLYVVDGGSSRNGRLAHQQVRQAGAQFSSRRDEFSRMFSISDVAVVDQNWVLDCVETGRLLPIVPYLQHDATVERLREAEYDPVLLS